MAETQRIGFIGGGAMAEALLGGLHAAGRPAAALRAADPDAARRAALTEQLGITTTEHNRALVEASDVVVLAVKPYLIDPVLSDLAAQELDLARPLWISIAAGITLDALAAHLGPDARIVRAMPNTPALVGAGASGFCANARADAGDREAARAVFASVGAAWEATEESQLDAVTGLSGSGPAYVFAFIEGLIRAGEQAGLPAEAAHELALQTAFGAAKLARESERTPAELRKQVATPGGTTEAGLAALAAHGLDEALAAAVRDATRRAAEIGRGE